MEDKASPFHIPDPHGRKARFIGIGVDKNKLKDLQVAIDISCNDGSDRVRGYTMMDPTEYKIVQAVISRVIRNSEERRRQQRKGTDNE